MHVAGYADELIEEVVRLHSTQSLNDTAQKRLEQGLQICLQHLGFQAKQAFWKAVCHT